jgi:DoxX-like family
MGILRIEDLKMDTDNASFGKARRIAGLVLICLGSIVLIGSAGAKFAHVPKVVNELGAMGFDDGRLTMIAVAEVVSALLFLLPFTRSIGLLLASAYMGGAIATHVQHGQPFIQPAMILAILWAGAWLRHPQVLWSMNPSSTSSYPAQHSQVGILKKASD